MPAARRSTSLPKPATEATAMSAQQENKKRIPMKQRRHANWWQGFLTLVLLGGVGILIALPLGLLFTDAIQGEVIPADTVRGALRDTALQQAFLTTLTVALLAGALATLLAAPVAHLAMGAGRAARLLIGLLGLLPLAMPPFVSAAVLLDFAHVLDQTGVTASSGGLRVEGSHLMLVVLFAMHYLPLILFSLMAGLIRTDRSNLETARNLGAGPVFVWRHITLPLTTPAYGLGLSLMLLRILEDVGTPLILGVDGMLAPQLVQTAIDVGSGPVLAGAALVLMLLTASVATLGWSSLSVPLDERGQDRIVPRPRRRRGPAAVTAILLVVALLGMLALAPQLWLTLMAFGTGWSEGLVPVSIEPHRYLDALPAMLPGMRTTLVYVAGTGLLVLLLGGIFGSLTRGPGRLSHSARFVLTAMFALPGLVLALAYAGTLHRIGIDLDANPEFAWLTLSLVVALKQAPLARHLIASRLRGLHGGELDSAYSLGASPFFAALRIGLPSLSGVMAVAFLLGGLGALLELSVAMLLLHDQSAPLALATFHALSTGADSQAAASQALSLVALSLGSILLLWWLAQRHCNRMERLPPHLPAVARTPA